MKLIAIAIEHCDGDVSRQNTAILCMCAIGDYTKMTTSESAHVQIVDELLPLEGSVSPVWKYFGFPAENGRFLVTLLVKREHVSFQKM